MKKIATSVLFLAIGFAAMFAFIEVGRADTPSVTQLAQARDTTEHPYRPLVAQAPGSGAVTIPPYEGPPLDVPATETSTAQALPDPSAEPTESATLVWKLYKAGHLIPALIVFAFFALMLLQRWIAWLRTGYRKLVVASTLAGLAMLAERAANGETPNMMMIMGAFGAAIALYVKGEGETKAA